MDERFKDLEKFFIEETKSKNKYIDMIFPRESGHNEERMVG